MWTAGDGQESFSLFHGNFVGGDAFIGRNRPVAILQRTWTDSMEVPVSRALMSGLYRGVRR